MVAKEKFVSSRQAFVDSLGAKIDAEIRDKYPEGVGGVPLAEGRTRSETIALELLAMAREGMGLDSSQDEKLRDLQAQRIRIADAATVIELSAREGAETMTFNVDSLKKFFKSVDAGLRQMTAAGVQEIDPKITDASTGRPATPERVREMVLEPILSAINESLVDVFLDPKIMGPVCEIAFKVNEWQIRELLQDKAGEYNARADLATIKLEKTINRLAKKPE